MSSRDWIEKDFYRELGVSSDAQPEEIKKAYRKLARELHPDANPGDAKAEARFKAVSEAYGVLGDADKRKQYDEQRSLFGSGAFRPGSGAGGFGGFGTQGAGGAGGFDLNDLFGQATQQGATGAGGGGIGDLFGGLFGGNRRAGGATGNATRGRRGADVETDIRIDFADAVHGVTVPLQLAMPATCETCHGSGAKPGTSPRTCPTCNGAGLVTRNQGAFAFSEPCADCRGTGRLIDDPCPECQGSGTSTKIRTLTVRIPPGVNDAQRIRIGGKGEAGVNGGPNGDLYVRVHVNPHPIFGRTGDDLTITVPVTFPELVMGTTLTVPTLEGKVSLKVVPGTRSGQTLRARKHGIAKRDGKTGDLLVTLQVDVPAKLDDKAKAALASYADATSGRDPRSELNALLGAGETS